jgi:hypothetical protein
MKNPIIMYTCAGQIILFNVCLLIYQHFNFAFFITMEGHMPWSYSRMVSIFDVLCNAFHDAHGRYRPSNAIYDSSIQGSVDSIDSFNQGSADNEIADEIAEQSSHRAGARPRMLRRVHPESGMRRHLASHQRRIAYQSGQFY